MSDTGSGTKEWVRLREVSPSGALLARPDTIIGWRGAGHPDHPAGPLDATPHRPGVQAGVAS